MKLTFHGAARTVTGSKHLLTLDSGTKILLDCGLFQGMGEKTVLLNHTFGFDPSSVDILILSHAHIDHAGLIPKLVAEGFKGKIIATPATKDLATLLLHDSAHIQQMDTQFLNKRRVKQNKPLIKPLYTGYDVTKCLELFTTLPPNQNLQINDEAMLTFTDAGHILGAAVINLSILQNTNKIKICFSGDIGRYDDDLLKSPAPFQQSDIIICESTYGNRLHSDATQSEKDLLEIIKHTCIEKKGKVIIPAFSVGRTQEIVFLLNKFAESGLMDRIPVYVDSPLSSKATAVISSHPECYNDKLKKFMLTDSDPFGFKSLKFIEEKTESQALNLSNEPCVIISASGMAEAGRIKHHISHTIEDAKNTILMVGYAEPTSLGGKLAAGASEVKIFGELFKVNAEVKVFHSFSAHADYEELLRFLSCQNPAMVEKVFLVHGEYDVQQEFAKKLNAVGFKNVIIPEMHQEFEI